jgi:hypothetical protein
MLRNVDKISSTPVPGHPRRLFSYDVTTLAAGAAVVSVAFLLYFLTAGRDIVVGDTPELITAAATLGVPHAPGYPLFTMLGYFASLLPVGPIPFRVNLLAILCQALTIGFVFLTALRLSGSRSAAAIAALALAVTPIFWAWSLVTEVFPLNNLLASLLIYLLVRWQERPERTGFLIAIFFLGGLALTNHQTIVLLGPAFCFVLWRGRAVLRGHPQIFAICMIAFLIGLLPYAYVPWAAARHPVMNWGGVSSLRDLVALILRKSYGTSHLARPAEFMSGSSVDRVFALFRSFGPLMGLLVLCGTFQTYRKRRWYFYFTLLAFAWSGPFFVSIFNLNIGTNPTALYVLERFFLLSQVVLAPLMGLGVLLIAELIASSGLALPKISLRLVIGAAGTAIFATVLLNYRALDQSHNHIARSFAEDIFASVDPGSILLVSGDETVLPLMYLQVVEGRHQDVTLVLQSLLRGDWYLRQLRERYPDFNLPFTHYDGQNNSVRMLIEANNGRRIFMIGPVPDNDKSLKGSYRFVPHGLVDVIEPMGHAFDLEQVANDNKQLLNRYQPPAPHAIKSKSFESTILSDYAEQAWRIGKEYERLGLRQEARSWYERAIAVRPDLPKAQEALARLKL